MPPHSVMQMSPPFFGTATNTKGALFFLCVSMMHTALPLSSTTLVELLIGSTQKCRGNNYKESVRCYLHPLSFVFSRSWHPGLLNLNPFEHQGYVQFLVALHSLFIRTPRICVALGCSV